MENEWVAGIILTGLMCFCVIVTLLVKSAKRNIEASEAKKELLKRGIIIIKQKWNNLGNQ
jgi:hypothetical protein